MNTADKLFAQPVITSDLIKEGEVHMVGNMPAISTIDASRLSAGTIRVNDDPYTVIITTVQPGQEPHHILYQDVSRVNIDTQTDQPTYYSSTTAISQGEEKHVAIKFTMPRGQWRRAITPEQVRHVLGNANLTSKDFGTSPSSAQALVDDAASDLVEYQGKPVPKGATLEDVGLAVLAVLHQRVSEGSIPTDELTDVIFDILEEIS